VLSRAGTRDTLLRRTGAAGIHFKDFPQLQGYDQPQWSHLSAPEAKRFIAAMDPIDASCSREQPMPELQAGIAARHSRGH